MAESGDHYRIVTESSFLLSLHSEQGQMDIPAEYDRKQYTEFMHKLLEVTMKGQSKIEELQLMEEGVCRASADNENRIKETCNDVRKILQINEDKLLSEGRQFREKQIKNIKLKRDEVKLELQRCMASLVEMVRRGSSSDSVGDGNELKLRVDSLQASYSQIFSAEHKLDRLVFQPNNDAKFERNQIGKFITEKFLITIGLYTGATMEQKICRINLDNPDKINVIDSTPTEIRVHSAACVIKDILYAVGIGRAGNEMWAWSAERDKWTRRADMTSGRCQSCVTSVGDKIYVLGGTNREGEKPLDSIICYNIVSDTWTEPGKLLHAVYDAACVTYKHYIYVFGGGDKNKMAVKHVQVCDTATGNISLSFNEMPKAHALMKAVQWGSKALIISEYTCYIYDLELGTWSERERFKTDGLSYFGLTLDEDTLYISGGGKWSTDANNQSIWICTDNVKSLQVEDFISDNKEAEWKHHAKLPVPAMIYLYSSASMLK